MRKFLSVVLACLFGFASPVWGQSQSTDVRPDAKRIIGDALLVEFKGVTHKGAYNFSDAGEPRKFYTETTRSDGKTIYSDNTTEAEGVWIILRDTLCFVYQSDDMSGGCFRVYKVGNCFYYYSDQLIERENELDREYWTARSVKDGEVASCEPGTS
jgi:hypothetical protein